MTRKAIWIVYKKELKESLRDRRTLIFMLLFPIVVLPLVGQLLIQLTMQAVEKAETEPLPYVAFHLERLPGLADRFTPELGFEQVEGISQENVKQAIDAETIKFALVAADTKPDAQHQLTLFFNGASATSKVKKRVQKVVDAYNQALRDEKLETLGLTSPEARMALLEQVALQAQNTADLREVMGEQVGGFLPYLFIIFCFLGALYPAIDLGAGEKERGTLETLLLAPIQRGQIVLGKFLVIFTAGVTSALLSIVGLGAWLLSQRQDIGGVVGEIIQSVEALDLFLIAAMLIPTAAIFASLLLGISIYAKSFKEAQSYSAPLNLLMILPAAVAMMPGVELNSTWAMVPITNVSLAIKELVKGTMDYYLLILILASTTLLAGVLLFLSTRWFSREQVLFRN